MSWQDYVDTHLVGTGKISQALILGRHESGVWSVWARSPGFKISPEEEKAILAAYTNPDGVLSSGLKLAGQKYFALSANNRSIYLKKQADGVVIVKTKTVILVAQYVAPIQAGEATPVVEGLADYLIGHFDQK